MPWLGSDPSIPGSKPKTIPKGYFKVRNMVKRNRRWRKKTKAPSRYYSSKSRYSLNRLISSQVNRISENKFRGFTASCLRPVPKPAGTQPLSYIFLNSGEQLSHPSDVMYQPMNLFNFPRGDLPTERNGDYMYIKKSHIKFEIQMLPTSVVDTSALNSTTEFRLMVVKANRALNKLGVSPISGGGLFLNPENESFGFGVPGGLSTNTTFENTSQPINKRQWIVYKDTKFTLSTPAQECSDNAVPAQFAYNTANNKYPVKKFFSFNLPIWKKTHFNTQSHTPDSVDTQFLIILQACRTNYCADLLDVNPPENFRVNVLGTTSASDN